MKIGIFDSGLGGLLVGRAIRKAMPQYDYIYLGDTKNLPYGDKSQSRIYQHTVKAVKFLFEQNCGLVVVACNTISAQALRKIQREWLPKSEFKDRRVLGVIRPTVETLRRFKRVGIIGTVSMIGSTAYLQELKKINDDIKLSARATPKLVPMIEAGEYDEKVLKKYLAGFENVDALILGCTHYGLLKKEIKKILARQSLGEGGLGSKIKIIAQEELVPGKLKNYLSRHPEIKKTLSRHKSHFGSFEILVTKTNDRYQKLAGKWFSGKVHPRVVTTS